MKRTTRIVAAFLAAGLVAGCADMGALTTQSSTRDANSLATTRSLGNAPLSVASWPTSDWWKAFNDPQLDQLIDEALVGQPDAQGRRRTHAQGARVCRQRARQRSIRRSTAAWRSPSSVSPSTGS